jgi:hypothetical protein
VQELLARRASLTAEERAELEALIDAELAATAARTDPLVPVASRFSPGPVTLVTSSGRTLREDPALPATATHR